VAGAKVACIPWSLFLRRLISRHLVSPEFPMIDGIVD
jgi:hypothetical protein